MLDGNEAKDPGPELLSLAGDWAEELEKVWAPFPAPEVWPSHWDRLWERSFSASGGLAPLGTNDIPLFFSAERKAAKQPQWEHGALIFTEFAAVEPKSDSSLSSAVLIAMN